MDHADSDELSMNDAGTCEQIDKPLPNGRSRGVRGFVYFVQAAEAIKIGFTKDTPDRIASLQTASAEELVLLGTIRGTRKDEKEHHRMFCHLQIRGEWFRAEEELTDYIKSALMDEEWKSSLPAPSAETLAAIKPLAYRRRICGAESPIGHRYTNLIAQIRNHEHATGDRVEILRKAMRRQIADLENLQR